MPWVPQELYATLLHVSQAFVDGRLVWAPAGTQVMHGHDTFAGAPTTVVGKFEPFPTDLPPAPKPPDPSHLSAELIEICRQCSSTTRGVNANFVVARKLKSEGATDQQVARAIQAGA